MSLVLAPDVESLAIQYLKAHDELEDVRIASELPAKAEFPFVTVLLVGGIQPVAEYLEGYRLQVDTYGGTREEARLLARTVHAALLDMTGTHDEGIVTGIATLIPLRHLSDPSTGRVRFNFDVRVWCHPAPDLGS